MKRILSVLKEKHFTKHEREHSEQYYKTIDILNRYFEKLEDKEGENE